MLHHLCSLDASSLVSLQTFLQHCNFLRHLPCGSGKTFIVLRNGIPQIPAVDPWVNRWQFSESHWNRSQYHFPFILVFWQIPRSCEKGCVTIAFRAQHHQGRGNIRHVACGRLALQQFDQKSWFVLRWGPEELPKLRHSMTPEGHTGRSALQKVQPKQVASCNVQLLVSHGSFSHFFWPRFLHTSLSIFGFGCNLQGRSVGEVASKVFEDNSGILLHLLIISQVHFVNISSCQGCWRFLFLYFGNLGRGNTRRPQSRGNTRRLTCLNKGSSWVFSGFLFSNFLLIGCFGFRLLHTFLLCRLELIHLGLHRAKTMYQFNVCEKKINYIKTNTKQHQLNGLATVWK